MSQPDARLVRLKNYFEEMGSSLPEVTTMRFSDEVKDMLIDPAQVRDEKRSQVCSDDDLRRLVELELEARNLEAPDSWTWDPKPGSNAEKYAEERMRYWLEEETAFRVLEKCPQCHCSDILMGRERESDYCRDCMTLARRGKHGEKKKTKVSCVIITIILHTQKYEILMCVYFSTYLCVQVLQAWSKVRPPTGKFPTRVDAGHEGEDLPELSVAEKSVIAPVQPVVTVTKNYMAQMKLRQESITLTQDPDQTWACVLPRTDLCHSHILIERTNRNQGKRYLVAERAKAGTSWHC